MAETSKIEWTDATWNPVTGCSVISPGCTNCYAMRLAGTRLQDHPSRAGLTQPSKAGPVWNGQVRLNEAWLTQPLRWRRPRRIFVCAHGDLFHEAVPDAWIDKVFAVMALAPHHTFQVLTKRAERMRDYLTSCPPKLRQQAWASEFVAFAERRLEVGPAPELRALFRHDEPVPWPLPNVWLGVSAEDQERADERVPLLLQTPASVRFLSAEPLVGGIDLKTLDLDGESFMDALAPRAWADEWEQWQGTSDTAFEDFCDWFNVPGVPGGNMHPTLDWVIVGGESGPGARPMHPDWACRLRDDCAAAGVPFFFKQWGEWNTQVRPDQMIDLDGAKVVLQDGQRMVESGLTAGRTLMTRVGKAAAGRLLDGVAHDAMPEAR